MKRRGNKIEEEKKEKEEEEEGEGEWRGQRDSSASLSLSSFFLVLFLEGEVYRGKGDVRWEELDSTVSRCNFRRWKE